MTTMVTNRLDFILRFDCVVFGHDSAELEQVHLCARCFLSPRHGND